MFICVYYLSIQYYFYKRNQYYIILINMGNKNQPPPKPLSKEQVIMELKLNSKRFALESKKSQKEKQKIIQKAKKEMKKNNEEGAKLYLTQASMKDAQSKNYLRMSMKTEQIAFTLKNANNNQVLLESFNKMTNLLSYQKQYNPNIQQMATNLQNFENVMDNMFVNNQVMNQLINKNNNETNADQMLDALKGQVALEHDMKMNQLGIAQNPYISSKQAEKQKQNQNWYEKF